MLEFLHRRAAAYADQAEAPASQSGNLDQRLGQVGKTKANLVMSDHELRQAWDRSRVTYSLIGVCAAPCHFSVRSGLTHAWMTAILVALYNNTILGKRLGFEAGRNGIVHMIYKGVEYTITAVAPGIWKWQFRIGDKVITGKTEAKLDLLAIRRVQLRIDRELKKAERQ